MMDRVKQSFSAFVRSVMHETDFHAFYPSKVLSQNPDGSLEVRPDNTDVPACSRVQIRYGLPGVAVAVTGGRVLLGFEGGDPSKPMAALFEVAGVSTVYLGGQQANGSDVTNFAALANLVQTALDSIKSTYNSHTHTGVTTGSGSSGTPASAIGTLGPVAAAHVKVL